MDKILKFENLRNIYQTGAAMASLVKNFNGDVSSFDGWSFDNFFLMCCSLPYLPDPEGIETIHRPKFSLSNMVKYRDCDDKCVLLGSYLFRHGVPFKFVAQSQRPDKKIHHVSILTYDKKNLDCTYMQNYFGDLPPVTYQIAITPWIRL
jgi:hypothetical protein